MMAEQAKHISYREIVGIGICPKCRVIYKARATEVPKDGIHRCHQCGEPVKVGSLSGR